VNFNGAEAVESSQALWRRVDADELLPNFAFASISAASSSYSLANTFNFAAKAASQMAIARTLHLRALARNSSLLVGTGAFNRIRDICSPHPALHASGIVER
jgi:hypothetical protein